jgi:hypothetical protein
MTEAFHAVILDITGEKTSQNKALFFCVECFMSTGLSFPSCL